MPDHFYRRYGLAILALSVLTLPLVLYSATKAVLSNSNNPVDWLPETFEDVQRYFWFYDRFGGDELLVVSWPGCTLDDPRAERLVAALLGPPRGTWQGGAPWFRYGYTGSDVLRSLTAPPLNLDRQAALQRLQGWLVGPDLETTCAVLLVSPEGMANRAAAVEAVLAAAETHCGLPREALHVGGPTMDSVAIDAESNKALYVLTTMSVVIGFLLAWWFLRSLYLMAAVFLTAMLCECWSLSLVHWLGAQMDSVLIMMPALVYILALSGAIHLLNYYRETVALHGPQNAVVRAVRQCWLPTFLASTTTAIGLGSLVVSDIVPIKKFGFYSAAGVLLSLAFLFLVLPSILERWPLHLSRRARRAAVPAAAARRFWAERVADVAIGHAGLVAAVGLLMASLLAWGVTKLETSVKLHQMFRADSEVIQHYAWLEDHLGPLVPVEIVLAFPQGHEWSTLRRVQFVEQAREALAERPDVGGTLSLATFLPDVSDARSGRQQILRTMLNRRLRADHEQLTATGYLAHNQGSDLFRITLRVRALDDLDYRKFLGQLRGQLDALIARHTPPDQPAVTHVVCGGVPLVSIVQQTLMDDLIRSFSTAFLLIFFMMFVALRSVWAVVATVVPNIFPTVVILGGLGWLGNPIDLGSMMTVSVALGIAVDNELHFFTWFRRAIAQGLSRADALRSAYRHCARAMTQTALICGLGLSVFALSPFVPIARFGYLMCALLLAALVGDLLILPAMLMGPPGRRYAAYLRRTHQVQPAGPSSQDRSPSDVATDLMPAARAGD